MKRGLNFTDVNTLRLGIQSGWSIEEIARECATYPEVIQKYMDSIPEDVEQWRTQAPTTGIDMDLLKAQLKRELLEEMRSGPVEVEPDYEDMVEEEADDES